MTIINASNIEYTYPDGTTALKEVSFTVNNDERIAIIGHNGSGKSTLLMLLSGLLVPTAGELRIFNIVSSHTTKAKIRKAVGIVFPYVEYQFIMPNLLHDVMLSVPTTQIEEKKRIAIHWLQKLHLDLYQNHNPLILSTGLMKKAALAAICAKNPQLLLLDEPLANLDKPSSDDVISILQSLTIPIIFATHSLYAVKELANRIIVLEKGKKVYDDSIHNKRITTYIKTILL